MSTDAVPDVPFTLAVDGLAGSVGVVEPGSAAAGMAGRSAEIAGTEPGAELLRQIAVEFASVAPAGWRQLEVLFVATVEAGMAQAYCSDAAGNAVELEIPDEVTAPTHAHRALMAELTGRAWWRMTLRFTDTGQLDTDLDYGDDPIPVEHRLAPESYAADLQAFPRSRLPIWLAAYLGPAGRQSRSPQRAIQESAARRVEGIRMTELPALQQLWARWAVISAAFVAGRPAWGPRIVVSAGWFEGSRGGSSLLVLPGGRAVLSGGTADAPTLDAAYNDNAELPDLYAGAPDWVNDPMLNSRAAQGLLSFCYWWDGDCWYRGDSPDADQVSAALPGIWTVETVVELVSTVLPAHWSSVTALVRAAEQGAVTRDLLAEVLPHNGDFDFDEVWYQLSLAGVTAAAVSGRSEVRA